MSYPSEFDGQSVLEIRLEGEFDLAERRRVTDAFAIANGTPLVVLNLSKATFVDSTVLQCIAALELATRNRGARLVLTGVTGAVRQLFQASRLDEMFDIQQDTFNGFAAGPEQIRRLTLVAMFDGKTT